MELYKLSFANYEGGRTTDKLIVGNKVIIRTPQSDLVLGKVKQVLKTTVKVITQAGYEITFTNKGTEYGKSGSRYSHDLYEYDNSFEDHQKAVETRRQNTLDISTAKKEVNNFLKQLHQNDDDWLKVKEALKGML